MSWPDFELLLGEAFRLQGFAVAEGRGAGADGGVDLELTKGGERYLVQAKHWRARQVPVEVVRELAGVIDGLKDRCEGPARWQPAMGLLDLSDVSRGTSSDAQSAAPCVPFAAASRSLRGASFRRVQT